MKGQLSTEERQTVCRLLDESLDNFRVSVSAVPVSLWNARPTPNQWSPQDIAEHIVLTEDMVFSLLRTKLLISPERPVLEQRARLDEIIPLRVVRRTGRRLDAPPPLVPAKRFENQADVLTAFTAKRQATMDYAATTEDPLRLHTAPHPGFGEMDGYQWLLFLGAHCKRHVLQIEEAMHAGQ